VQVHPTAFVNKKEPNATKLTLAAELLRGVGGILLDQTGARFADELGKRDYVTGRMMEVQPAKPHYTLLLTEAHAQIANKHVPHYIKKDLLVKLESLDAVATWMGVDKAVLDETLTNYMRDAAAGVPDAFGKQYFHNPAFGEAEAPFYVGTVTPAIHYTMGGISIDNGGRVLQEGGQVFPGLFAAGEITGGVHGVNRLGGNALTECIVFGQLVGENVPIVKAADTPSAPVGSDSASSGAVEAEGTLGDSGGGGLRKITAAELATHDTEEDCWVAVYGKIYDFTDFLEEHPGGVESVTEFAGADGTETFDSIHSRSMLEDFDPLGVLEGADQS
jgi:succinate dehydrogenase/fumarate reductase flavoprotein subunit